MNTRSHWGHVWRICFFLLQITIMVKTNETVTDRNSPAPGVCVLDKEYNVKMDHDCSPDGPEAQTKWKLECLAGQKFGANSKLLLYAGYDVQSAKCNADKLAGEVPLTECQECQLSVKASR